jgi:hypothetical protein
VCIRGQWSSSVFISVNQRLKWLLFVAATNEKEVRALGSLVCKRQIATAKPFVLGPENVRKNAAGA